MAVDSTAEEYQAEKDATMFGAMSKKVKSLGVMDSLRSFEGSAMATLCLGQEPEPDGEDPTKPSD